MKVVVGNRLLGDEEKVADAGIAADAAVSVVFKTNAVRCSDQNGIISLLGEIDTELLLVVEIPGYEHQISARAFEGCKQLATVTIADSVTRIGTRAFQDCASLAHLTIPNSVTHIGDWAFANCRSLANLDHHSLSDRYWE